MPRLLPPISLSLTPTHIAQLTLCVQSRKEMRFCAYAIQQILCSLQVWLLLLFRFSFASFLFSFCFPSYLLLFFHLLIYSFRTRSEKRCARWYISSAAFSLLMEASLCEVINKSVLSMQYSLGDANVDANISDILDSELGTCDVIICRICSLSEV